MTDAQILIAIAELAAEHLGWRGPLDRGARLIEDLELDSLRSLTLAVAVEDRFRVVLEPEDEAGLKTVGDLADVVRHKLDAQP